VTWAQTLGPTCSAQSLAGLQVRLPLPGDPFRPDGHDAGLIPATGWTRAPDDSDDLARYRWWLGHQLTFCVWRLLSERLAAVATDQRRCPETIADSIAMYDVYSVLLLYAGSCSPAVYRRTIRPDMADADAAFSGRWARDYEDIPVLLRAIRRTRPTALVDGLLAAARTNQVVHMAVGKRLVPQGSSLLRQSNRNNDQPVTDRERNLFDTFFLVKRASMARSTFSAQLRALAGLVAGDIAQRPLLDPAVIWDVPAGHADLIVRFQRDASTLLRDFLLLPLDEGPCQ
jgi:L-tyrosine peroxygenase